jgi:lipopolysaccharide/colanic/teichoic acid biosynthesis glycosyltransferase
MASTVPEIEDPALRPLARPGAGTARARSSVSAIRVGADLLALAAAVGTASFLRFGLGLLQVTHEAPFDLAAHALAAALWIGGLVAVMASHRLYDEDTLSSRRTESQRIRTAVLEGIAVVSVAVFLLRLVTVSRGWFVALVVTSYALVLAERAGLRLALSRARRHGRLRRAVVLVGAPGDSGVGDEFEIVARLSIEDLPAYLERAAERRRRWGVPAPGLLLQADERPSDEIWDLVVRAGGAGLPVYVASPVRSVAIDRLTARELDGRTIVKVSPPALVGVRAFEKRAFDLVVASTLLMVLSLPMLAIAIGVLVTSGRPIFFGQERIGRGGRPFRMWKFRSMVVDAERESGPVWTARGDPRRTPIGRFLRVSSLDELPQLWNALTGKMSIVGPRPERPGFVASFNDELPDYHARHRIRPGITGLAQVRGLRGDTDLAPRVDADNRYIEHWSLSLDLAIAARTVLEVVRHRNAG